MERFNISYSQKKIPIQTEKQYKIQLIAKIENLVKTMRWKALDFLGKLDNQVKDTYGFKSSKCPPSVNELSSFESDLLMMIHNVEFQPVKNRFLSKLKEDVKTIKNTKELLINADKSSNIYKMDKDTYKKYLKENVTKKYKKSNRNKVIKINIEAKKIAKKLNIDDNDKVQKFHEAEAFITIKDHKDSFPNFPTIRLINPSKSEIRKISKSILDKINNVLVEKAKVNLWKNSANTIKWIKSIPNEKASSFVKLGVENFYPSISEDLLTDAISCTKSLIDIMEQEYSIITHSRKIFLFQNSKPWMKKDGNQDFDIPMGCYDGAEICELADSFILSQLGSVMDKNDIRLYRDDSIGIIHGISKPMIEKKKKLIPSNNVD